MILSVNSNYFRNSVNQLIFVMVKCGVFFAVRTEFLNTKKKRFGKKGEGSPDELRALSGNILSQMRATPLAVCIPVILVTFIQIITWQLFLKNNAFLQSA
jgi:hypothetical protein